MKIYWALPLTGNKQQLRHKRGGWGGGGQKQYGDGRKERERERGS